MQAQLDNYEVSLDNKIDGGIASYLAGLQIVPRQKLSILTKEWNYVVALNGSISNTYDYPDVIGTIAICQRYLEGYSTPSELHNTVTMKGTVGAPAWYKQVYGFGRFSYAYTNINSTRNLVNNVEIGSTLDKSNMVWAGRANKAKESWTLSIVRRFSSNPSGMQTFANNVFRIAEMLNLVRTGYISSWTDTSNPVWKPGVRWQSASGGWYNWGYGTTYAVSSIPEIEYLKDNDGNVKSYEHIITHKSTDSWELCAENVTRYISLSSKDTRRTDTWVTKTTQSGTWNGCEYSFQKHATATSNIKYLAICMDKGVQWSDETISGGTNKKQIPVLGLIGTSTSGSIYQFGKDDIVDEDGNKLDRRKLNEGLPVMKVKYGETVEWNPVFKNIKIDGVGTINEAKLILSYVPFTERGVSTDYVKMDGITKGEWITTSGKTAKVSFKAEKDGVIYAKWVPNYNNTATIDGTTYWEATLDLEKCNTYTSVRE